MSDSSGAGLGCLRPSLVAANYPSGKWLPVIMKGVLETEKFQRPSKFESANSDVRFIIAIKVACSLFWGPLVR